MNEKCSAIASEMEPTKGGKIVLFSLLIILNLILRIPSIPHAKGGGDSFVMQQYVNSITRLGVADWWVNWYSVFGLYPNSYASSVPFTISGLSQLTGLSSIKTEYSLLLFSIIIGLISIFTAYLLAGIIYDDFLFKYIMALFFSTAQGVMIFSTWEVSARGPFIVLLPLFIFILFKKIHYLKKISLLIILGVYIAATHHFYIFLIPFTGLYLFMNALLKNASYMNIKKYYGCLYFVGLILILAYPFLTGSMITAGSRYQWILDMLKINLRWVGPIIVLFAGGLIYLILKENKKFEEWYFLLAFLGISTFLYDQTYGVYVVLLFPIFFASIAFKNIINLKSSGTNKIIFSFIIILIVSSITFSAFFNHHRTSSSEDYWYMSDEEYMFGKWGENHVPEGIIAIGPSLALEYVRIMATSNGRPLPPQVNRSEVEVIKVNSSSVAYYFEGPYVLKPNTSLSGLINWLFEIDNVDSSEAQSIIKKLNASYYLDITKYHTNLVDSIRNQKGSFYDSGRIKLWLL